MLNRKMVCEMHVTFDLHHHGFLIHACELAIDRIFLADDDDVSDGLEIFSVIFTIGLIRKN